MYKKLITCLVLITGVIATVQSQQKNALTITEQKATNSFQLFNAASIASLTIDAKDAKVVSLAADAFVKDVELVSGKIMQLNNTANAMQIVVGTIGQSKYIDQLIKEKRIDVSSIQNKWECFSIEVIKENSKGSELPFRGGGVLFVAPGSGFPNLESRYINSADPGILPVK